MYKFDYEIMKKKYDKRISQIQIFFYEIETDDFYKDILQPDLKMFFGRSNFPSSHECYSSVN